MTTTIVHKRGDTLELTLQLKSNDVATDITGYTFSSQLRDSTDTLLVTDNFDGNLTYTLIDALEGQFSFTASPTETAEWDTRTYDCDIQITEPDSDVASSETFKIKVVKDITRV